MLRAFWNDTNTWSGCVRIGELLATESLRIIDSAPWQKSPVLRNHWEKVDSPVESNELWVVELSSLKYPHGNRTMTSRLNLIELGNAQFLTIPGHALPNIGFYLKRKIRGEHNFLFGLTNDAFGYLLTKADFHSFPSVATSRAFRSAR